MFTLNKRQLPAIIILLIASILSFHSCSNKEQNAYEISSHKIGGLTPTTRIQQLDSLFAQDSIVYKKNNSKFLSKTEEIEIYEKGGQKILILEAEQEKNKQSTVKSIQLISDRYQTANGLSVKSNFKEIKDQFTISKIRNTLSSAVIFIDSIQASIAIDKKDLPKKFKFDTSLEIKPADIPDSAKIKHFLINW